MRPAAVHSWIASVLLDALDRRDLAALADALDQASAAPAAAEHSHDHERADLLAAVAESISREGTSPTHRRLLRHLAQDLLAA